MSSRHSVVLGRGIVDLGWHCHHHYQWYCNIYIYIYIYTNIYIYIYIHTSLSLLLVLVSVFVTACLALLVSRCLSNTASFVSSAFRRVRDHHGLLHYSPRLKKTSVRQVVLGKFLCHIYIYIYIHTCMYICNTHAHTYSQACYCYFNCSLSSNHGLNYRKVKTIM